MSDGAPQPDRHPGADACITCGDVAVWLRVASVQPELGLARCVDAEGRAESVAIELVEPVGLGEMLLVHAGAALARRAGAQGTPEAAQAP